jgi:hypothetical protein
LAGTGQGQARGLGLHRSALIASDSPDVPASPSCEYLTRVVPPQREFLEVQKSGIDFSRRSRGDGLFQRKNLGEVKISKEILGLDSKAVSENPLQKNFRRFCFVRVKKPFKEFLCGTASEAS